MESVVVDTNVFISALLKKTSAPRQVVRFCLNGEVVPLMGNALYLEFEAVLGRSSLFQHSVLSEEEREELFDAFLSVCKWVPIYYLWRPNLPDEADNHLIELAIAGNARWIITGNTKDFSFGEIRLPGCEFVTPSTFLKERRS